MKEYLSSYPITYTDLVFMAEIDEIMAEYLLKGAKMLAKTCPVCHAPLFEYKGRQFCVVCDEAGVSSSEPKTDPKPTMPVDTPREHDEPVEVPVKTPPSRVDAMQELQTGISSSLADSISEAMVLLSGRIVNEPDPARCLLYMQAIREGALSIATLRVEKPHHHRKE